MLYLFLFLLFPLALFAEVQVGVDLLFQEPKYQQLLDGKKIGLITNHSAVNREYRSTFDLFKSRQTNYKLKAVFAPEHGFYGNGYAYEEVEDQTIDGISLYSLHSGRRRPPPEILIDLDLLIYDIQDVGSRSYTYISTLFYCMEEAAKHKIPLIVLDRPNPMGGVVVDGPLVEDEWRSFLGYVNVPYCHGMTIGELATLFNKEYKVGCDLTVIPMKGWKRGTIFADTGLPWVPTSPQIPECDTPFFYAATGLIGHCSIASIGIGYTLPFKLIGAPWINANEFAAFLNRQNLPGVHFQPFYFRPFYGKFKLENCEGVRLVVTNAHTFLPVTTQFTIIGVLKALYPKYYHEALQKVLTSRNKRDVFNKLSGSSKILRILSEEKYLIWPLRALCVSARDAFLPVRRKYLFTQYS